MEPEQLPGHSERATTQVQKKDWEEKEPGTVQTLQAMPAPLLQAGTEF